MNKTKQKQFIAHDLTPECPHHCHPENQTCNMGGVYNDDHVSKYCDHCKPAPEERQHMYEKGCKHRINGSICGKCWVKYFASPPQPLPTIDERIEEILRNRIVDIISEYKGQERKDGYQVYLGYPQQLIDELVKALK